MIIRISAEGEGGGGLSVPVYKASKISEKSSTLRQKRVLLEMACPSSVHA